jgi:nicotinamidase-related amidase
MMTHMCVEAATRAGHDYGFDCSIIQDACATKALQFAGKEISAENVHYAILATLSGIYAKVLDTESFLEGVQ